MSALEKRVPCSECKKEIVFKTLKFVKAKYVNKAWICEDCQNKKKSEAAAAAQSDAE